MTNDNFKLHQLIRLYIYVYIVLLSESMLLYKYKKITKT